MVGSGAALGLAAEGVQTIMTPSGLHKSPWGFVNARLLARAVKGAAEISASGSAVFPWLQQELARLVQESLAYRHGARTSALLDGRHSVVGMDLLVAWGLSIDPVRGLVDCGSDPCSDPDFGDTSAADDTVAAEIWYEVEVTNPWDRSTARYTALVDTGATYSVFPDAELRLGAKPGAAARTSTHIGESVTFAGVLCIQLLRRAHRISSSDPDPFMWTYDAVLPVSAATVSAELCSARGGNNPEVIAKLDGNFAVIGLNSIAALGLQLHSRDGLVAPCVGA